MRISLICLFLLFLILGKAHGLEPKEKGKKLLAIINLVDLETDTVLVQFSENLRRQLTRIPNYKILPKKAMEEQLKGYDKNLNTPCNSKECAFDLASLLQADALLFGTISRTNGMSLMTVKLLNVQTAKIDWSRVLTTLDSPTALMSHFKVISQKLGEFKEEKEPTESNNILAVMDFSEPIFQAKVLFERVLTRAHKFGYSEVMSPDEVKEMMSALSLDKSTILNSIHTLVEIGEKMGVSAILYTNLAARGKNFKHEMALFDVKDKSVILTMPPLPNATLREVLYMERHFFTALENLLNSGSRK